MLQSGELSATVTRKRIKNLYLRVQAPDGRIEISAPMRVSRRYILAFLESKREWIAKRRALLAQAAPPKRYVNSELHPLWGQDYALQIQASGRRSRVSLEGGVLQLNIPTGKPRQARRAALEAFYRQELRSEAQRRIPRWEREMNVRVSRLYVRRMRSLWGSCNPRAGSIRLNTVLATLKPDFLEYILVHEMAHLLEASHNKRFYAIMERYLPDWKARRKELKGLSLREAL